MEQPTSQKYADYAFGTFFAIAAVIAAIDLGQRIHSLVKGEKRSETLGKKLSGDKDETKKEGDSNANA